jgi:hypothetical protein
LKTYSEQLAAGVPLQLAVGGRVLYVQRSEAGQVLNIDFIQGAGKQSVARVGKGFKAAPLGGFDSIRLTASAAGTVDFVVTDGEVNAQFDDANTVIGNDDSQPVPVRLPEGQRLAVDIGGGNVEVTATNVGILSADDNPVKVQRAALSELVDHAPATIAAGAAQLLVDEPTFKRLIIRNASASAVVALGGSAVTIANAAIRLGPGDTFIEDDAAGAAWYAVADVNGADVRVLGVK